MTNHATPNRQTSQLFSSVRSATPRLGAAPAHRVGRASARHPSRQKRHPSLRRMGHIGQLELPLGTESRPKAAVPAPTRPMGRRFGNAGRTESSKDDFATTKLCRTNVRSATPRAGAAPAHRVGRASARHPSRQERNPSLCRLNHIRHAFRIGQNRRPANRNAPFDQRISAQITLLRALRTRAIKSYSDHSCVQSSRIRYIL